MSIFWNMEAADFCGLVENPGSHGGRARLEPPDAFWKVLRPMSMLRPQPGILEIAPYVGGASKIDGRADDVLKLSANENPAGPPESAVRAMAETLATMHRYPGVDHAGLRAAIADVHGLDAARIIIGVGSDEVLQLLAYAYAGPGDEVVHTEHGFSLYPIVARAAGATPVCVAERERVVDVDAILAAVTERTRLVYVTNPGNPTGTMIGEAALERLATGLPEACLLVLDGAYVEFAEGYDGGAALVERFEAVVMTRTFSKIYGLGGLRVGWGYGAARRDRCAQPHSGAVQHVQRGAGRSRGCDAGQGFRRRVSRSQRRGTRPAVRRVAPSSGLPAMTVRPISCWRVSKMKLLRTGPMRL